MHVHMYWLTNDPFLSTLGQFSYTHLRRGPPPLCTASLSTSPICTDNANATTVAYPDLVLRSHHHTSFRWRCTTYPAKNL